MKTVCCAALALCVLSPAALAGERRMLSPEESQQVIGALGQQSTQPLSEDPSCRADVSVPGTMSVAEGLGLQLQHAASEDGPVRISTFCVERPGYPKEKHQEYCVLDFSSGQSGEFGYGLAFLMDWDRRSIVAGSVECY